jgi:hypothetical protein
MAKKAPPKAAPRKKSSGDTLLFDKLAIREQLENWAIFRDAGLWDQFRSVWHDDGYMMATWFQGPFADFIRVNQEGWAKGKSTILHFLGGSSVEIVGKRAITQTKMTISQRAALDGVPVEVLCTGRFFDFFEKRKGRWAIVLRRLFYEKDRMDTIDLSQTISLDKDLLASFPVGYQHLAYLQTKLGFNVKRDMPGLKGPEADRLYEHGRNWLAGKPIDAAKR